MRRAADQYREERLTNSGDLAELDPLRDAARALRLLAELYQEELGQGHEHRWRAGDRTPYVCRDCGDHLY